VLALGRASKDAPHTPAAILRDAAQEARLLRMTGKNFVNAMFTTFMRVRFTNVFDVILQKTARACVWRAGITG
jgi:hypothetical protein